MIPADLPQQLTSDGIRQLLNPSYSGSSFEFILQLEKLSEDYSGNKICHLSDGFCFIKGILLGDARYKQSKGQVEALDIVSLRREDVVILGPQEEIVIEIKQIRSLPLRMVCAVGNPISYIKYLQNNFANPRGSLQISDGQKISGCSSIASIISSYPHASKWSFKGKVIKKPERINQDNPFMIISIMDEDESIIEGFFFGECAVSNFTKLQIGKEYLFRDGQVKTKKDSKDQFQIKFTGASTIVPVQIVKSSQKVETPVVIENRVRDIPSNSSSLVSLTSKVLKVKSMSKGRSLSVVDANGDIMEVMLWEEFQDEIEVGKFYKFENFRTKVYREMVSLQSVRYKSRVEPTIGLPQQQEPPQEQYKAVHSQDEKSKKKAVEPRDTFLKSVRDPLQVIDVTEAVRMKVTERSYADVNGFLIINTYFMDTKNFFNVECTGCVFRDISVDPFKCNKCKNPNPSVRWNIRCMIIDNKEDIKCALNEELSQRLLKMTSIEGYRLLMTDSEKLRRIIDEISHIEGIFKVKINPHRDTVYYNVMDMYRDDSTVALRIAHSNLVKTLRNAVKHSQ